MYYSASCSACVYECVNGSGYHFHSRTRLRSPLISCARVFSQRDAFQKYCNRWLAIWQGTFIWPLWLTVKLEIFVAFIKAIFWLSNFFHKTRSVGSQTFMNVKMNGKQMSDRRTTGEQTSDDRRLTKIYSGELPDGRFWRNFSLTKMSCYTVVLSRLSHEYGASGLSMQSCGQPATDPALH